MKLKKNKFENKNWVKDSLIQLEKLKQDHKLNQKQIKQEHKNNLKKTKKKYSELLISNYQKINSNFQENVFNKEKKKIIAKDLKTNYLNKYSQLKTKIKDLKKEAKKFKINKKKIITNINLIKNELKCLKLEYKLEYAKKFAQPSKTNKKFYLKNKNLKNQELKLIKSEFKISWQKVIQKQKLAVKNLKSKIKNKQNVLIVNKKQTEQDHATALLKEKLKQENKKKIKEELPEYKQGFLKTFRQLPIRLFKEFKRVNWIQSNVHVFKKFFLVCLMIAVIALFIFGVESFIVWLVKILHIAKF